MHARNAGYRPRVEATEPCVFRSCPNPAIVTLRLRVDEHHTALATCLGHADWLGAYADEDPNVRFEDAHPGAPRPSFPEEDIGTLAWHLTSPALR